MDLSPLFCHIGYGVLVPWPGIETVPPAVGTQSLNYWTTREVPGSEPLIPCCFTVLSSWGLTNHHIELWFYSLLSITQKIQIIFFTKASPDESVFKTRYFYLLCQIVGVESSPHIWEVSCVGAQVTYALHVSLPLTLQPLRKPISHSIKILWYIHMHTYTHTQD